MSDGEITERVIILRGQKLDLMRDPRLVTAETQGRLSVFGLKLDVHFLHQFLEANEGRNRLAPVTLAQEAHARVILQRMATVGMLALVPPNFIIYRDPADLVIQLLLDVTTDWQEYQRNPDDAQPFFTDAAWANEAQISPLWNSFLRMPMFEEMVETLSAPLSGIRTTVANVINRVQAREWMPPLSKEDRDAHQKACDKLHQEQADESIMHDHRLQYGENDPLPLESWEPTVFKEDQGIVMYRQHMNCTKDYLGPIHQWFYRHYGRDLNAEQVISLCLLWQIAGSCEEAFFLAKWIQPFSEMSCLGICHTLSIIEPPRMLPEYLNAAGEINWLKVPQLQLPFKTPLETCAFHEENATGPYNPLQDSDPLTYVASFIDNHDSSNSQ